MSDWIQLDPATLNLHERQQVNGIEITVGLSPYDVPDAVRGYYDVDIKRFVIEFSYIDDDEPQEQGWHNEHVTLYFGKNTGCLYSIHVNVDDLNIDEITLTFSIRDALGRLESDKRFAARRRHYDLAKEIVSKNASRLFGGKVSLSQ